MVGFKVGQKVVYPNHGIGTIEQIEQKQIGTNVLPFYTLRLAANNSVVLVPVSNASEVGLRAPISSGECELLFKALADDFSSPANDWKDRFKEFSEKMRTGDIFERDAFRFEVVDMDGNRVDRVLVSRPPSDASREVSS